jgi:hypothetical protein
LDVTAACLLERGDLVTVDVDDVREEVLDVR